MIAKIDQFLDDTIERDVGSPCLGLISTRSGRTDSKVRSPLAFTLTDSALTMSPEWIRTVARSSAPISSTVPASRLFSPMNWATKEFAGALVEIGRARELLDHAVVEHGDAVRHRQRLVLVVRDVDDGDAELARAGA